MRTTKTLLFGVILLLCISSAFAATSVKNATTYATNDWSGGTANWANPTYAGLDDANAAVATLNGVVSDYLNLSSFGFAIPADATINGIQVKVIKSTAQGSVKDAAVRLTKAYAITGDDKTNISTWGTSEVTSYYGNSTDLWGTTWTAGEINASGFGVLFSANKTVTTNPDGVNVDLIEVTVTYTPAADTTPPTCSYSNFTITNNSFMANHSCSEAANLTVRYGTTVNLGSTATNTTSATTTSLKVSSLTDSTLYYWNATSCDSSNNCQNTTGTYNLTTLDGLMPTCTWTNTSITKTSVVFSGDCNEAANLSINYGTTVNLGSSATNTTKATAVALNLTGLVNTTTYYWNVTSCDASSNCRTNTGGVYTFATLDGTAPSCTLTNESIGDTYALFKSVCDENANLTVRYGTTIDLGTTITNTTSATTTTINKTGLTGGTTYYWNATVCDSLNNCGTLGSYNFTTLIGPKSGLISTTEGALPFYTNRTNPQNWTHYADCLQDMQDGESCIVTWYVNATGTLYSNHTFWGYANTTQNATLVNTTRINITIVPYSAPGGDTCTYTSGNWAITCSDLCNITTNVDLGGNNITMTGPGTVKVTANITNWLVTRITNACVLRVEGNGGLKT